MGGGTLVDAGQGRRSMGTARVLWTLFIVEMEQGNLEKSFSVAPRAV